MFFPSPSLGIWWNTLTTRFLRIWLVRPRLHAKYMRRLNPYIPGGFNYSGLFTVYLLTNYFTRSWIKLSAFCMEFNTIYIWLHAQCQLATHTIYVYSRHHLLSTQCSITDWNYMRASSISAVHFLHGGGGSVLSRISFQTSLNSGLFILVVLTWYDFMNNPSSSFLWVPIIFCFDNTFLASSS